MDTCVGARRRKSGRLHGKTAQHIDSPHSRHNSKLNPQPPGRLISPKPGNDTRQRNPQTHTGVHPTTQRWGLSAGQFEKAPTA